MSAQILSTDDGILTVRISGKLAQAELAAVQQQAVQSLPQQPKVRILLLAENFEGWKQGDDWGDISFQIDNDRHIEKLAIVADKKWEVPSLVFLGKGIRKFPIEYFPPTRAEAARAWLGASKETS